MEFFRKIFGLDVKDPILNGLKILAVVANILEVFFCGGAEVTGKIAYYTANSIYYDYSTLAITAYSRYGIIAIFEAIAATYFMTTLYSSYGSYLYKYTHPEVLGYPKYKAEELDNLGKMNWRRKNKIFSRYASSYWNSFKAGLVAFIVSFYATSVLFMSYLSATGPINNTEFLVTGPIEVLIYSLVYMIPLIGYAFQSVYIGVDVDVVASIYTTQFVNILLVIILITRFNSWRSNAILLDPAKQFKIMFKNVEDNLRSKDDLKELTEELASKRDKKNVKKEDSGGSQGDNNQRFPRRNRLHQNENSGASSDSPSNSEPSRKHNRTQRQSNARRQRQESGGANSERQDGRGENASGDQSRGSTNIVRNFLNRGN